MDGTVDLLDTRGRMLRLLVAAVIGGVVSYMIFGVVQSLAVGPNPDPVSQMSQITMRAGLFLASTAIVSAVLSRVARRRSC
jgi:hypothetical protein